jgi:hypothetical protein
LAWKTPVLQDWSSCGDEGKSVALAWKTPVLQDWSSCGDEGKSVALAWKTPVLQDWSSCGDEGNSVPSAPSVPMLERDLDAVKALPMRMLSSRSVDRSLQFIVTRGSQ